MMQLMENSNDQLLAEISECPPDIPPAIDIPHDGSLLVNISDFPHLTVDFLEDCQFYLLAVTKDYEAVLKTFAAQNPDFVRAVHEIHGQYIDSPDAFSNAILSLEETLADSHFIALGYRETDIPPPITEDGGFALVAAAYQLDQERQYPHS